MFENVRFFYFVYLYFVVIYISLKIYIIIESIKLL